MATEISIPPPALAAAEIALVRRYLMESHHFSGAEWQTIRKIMQELGQHEVQFGRQRYRFARFYASFINGTYAYPFLRKLAGLQNVEEEGLQEQAKVARQIWAWLRATGVEPGQVPNTEYLLIYCLYRWGAFARGYIFETAILRDLQQAGISVNVHDPIKERFTPYDLHVPGVGYGDVKTSSYFLEDLVADAPAADFYITRVYVPSSRGYQRIVFLTSATWKRLPTTLREQQIPIVSSLTEAVPLLGQGVRLQLEHLNWIMIEYKRWQQLVHQLQQENDYE